MGAMRIIIIICLCLYVAFVVFVTTEKVISPSTAAGLISAALLFIILNIFETRKMLIKAKKEYEARDAEDTKSQDKAAEAILTRYKKVEKPVPVDDANVNDYALNGELVKLKASLTRNPELIYKKDTTGKTPLHYAVSGGFVEVAEFLLSNGIDINARDNDERTPLHNAAECGFSRIMELLIAKGAKVNARDKEGFTPLNFAMKSGKKEAEAVLLKHGGFLKPVG
jgi:ankyrin repeat protein